MRALVLGFLILGACVHTAAIRDFSAGAANYTALQGKRVAIVNDPARIEEGHGNWSDGHKYNFTEVRSAVTGALQRRLAPAAKSVSVISAQDLAASRKNFDVIVYPSAKSRVVNDFWTKGCLITFGLRVESANRLLAEDSQEFKKSFMGGSVGFESACQTAFANVLPIVTDRAMSNAAGK